MKKVISLLLVTALTGVVFAGGEGDKNASSSAVPVEMVTLCGTVIDFDSGEALTGVEVKIEGTDLKVYTDFDGNFELKNVTPGKYNLIASYISYKNSLVENFQADSNESNLEIKLQEEK